MSERQEARLAIRMIRPAPPSIGTWTEGNKLEVPEKVGRTLIEQGYAEPATAPDRSPTKARRPRKISTEKALADTKPEAQGAIPPPNPMAAWKSEGESD
ncbi:MAG: hypothetical protein KAY32_10530 [Candidatus Eisenbacteria sp.]|nr:hypothetical protein [Candidatus Eisenbacteria bacterium]